VRRWTKQWDATRDRDRPGLDALAARLAQTVPQTQRSSIVHGDYRLDNALVARSPAEASAGADGMSGPPHVAAILDWEMATLGDAAVDLGMLGVYWELARVADDDHTVTAVDPAAGYPDFAELVDAYADRLGAPPPDLAWYRAFAAYKLAVILEGVHVRFRAGGTVGAGFERVGDLVAPLAREGLARLTDRTGTARSSTVRTRAGEA
jgi:aminoglycoside phosphotransferase (APT) family kinase protein